MPKSFIFKNAIPADRPMIEHWVLRPHIAEWLHGKGLRNTLTSLNDSFEGASDVEHLIAYDGDTPFGYLLTSDIDQSDDWVSNIEFAGDRAISLDVFICETDYLGKGLGTQMITEFLKSHFANVSDVLIDPEVKNSRAIHVYQKIGFRIVDTFIAPWHPVSHYLMHLHYSELT